MEEIANYNYLESYIEQVLSRGRFSFSLEELRNEFPQSERALSQAIYRLKSKKKIAQIRQGYYAIITPQYSRQGMLSPYLFIDDMMKSLNKSYYVGVVSAAALYGAGHQQPMEFFIVTERPALRDIKNEKLKLNFLVKKTWDSEFLKSIKTDAGEITVSSPELTALDLLYYVQHTSLNRIYTILDELRTEMRQQMLAKTAKAYSNTITLQRLGYILEMELCDEKLASGIYSALKGRKTKTIPLAWNKEAIGMKNEKWNIIVNIKLEGDL